MPRREKMPHFVRVLLARTIPTFLTCADHGKCLNIPHYKDYG
jgi:hypothetical protein